ncbi:hypothetical protein WME94_07880 [Sorangium sp. So ce429]
MNTARSWADRSSASAFVLASRAPPIALPISTIIEAAPRSSALDRSCGYSAKYHCSVCWRSLASAVPVRSTSELPEPSSEISIASRPAALGLSTILNIGIAQLSLGRLSP